MSSGWLVGVVLKTALTVAFAGVVCLLVVASLAGATASVESPAKYWTRLTKTQPYMAWAKKNVADARKLEVYWLNGGTKPNLRSSFGRLLVDVRGDLRFAAGPAPQVSAVKVFLSPAGRDTNSCTQAAPCRSFQRGYERASPGQVVELASGDYGAQQMRRDVSKISPADVVLRPAPGASVLVAGLFLGVRGNLGSGPEHLTIKGFKDSRSPQGAFDVVGSSDVTLIGMDAANFYINMSSNITIRGGDWGPCTVPSTTCSNSKLDTETGTNILVENATFHDYRIVPGSGEHFECMIIFGGRNITLRGNAFRNCEFYNVLVQHPDWAGFAGPDGTWPRDMLIEHNTFSKVWEDGVLGRRFTALVFSARSVPFYNIMIRCNAFTGGSKIVKNDSWDRTPYYRFKVVSVRSSSC